MNTTPQSDRIRIAFVGRRNAGKSSLLNAIAGQSVSIVSDVPGTTTDPVRKAMEMLPLGPALLVDTAGLDDDQANVGKLRLEKARNELRISDLVVIVSDAQTGVGECELALIENLRRDGVPFIFVANKIDALPLADGQLDALANQIKAPVFAVSSVTREGIDALKCAIANTKLDEPASQRIIGDRLAKGDVAALVMPQDSAAPKGRLILPQQQTIRDIIDSGAVALVCQPSELAASLAALKEPPRIVITDSQVFKEVRDIVPQTIELTSFSILFARYKGDFEVLQAGAAALDSLKDGDRVLIAEGCTHHRQCDDIGTVKLPRWLKEYTGKNLAVEFCSGMGFPEDLKGFAIVIHCGGCMIPRREMRRRISLAQSAGVPIANYGLAIAKLRGVVTG